MVNPPQSLSNVRVHCTCLRYEQDHHLKQRLLEDPRFPVVCVHLPQNLWKVVARVKFFVIAPVAINAFIGFKEVTRVIQF